MAQSETTFKKVLCRECSHVPPEDILTELIRVWGYATLRSTLDTLLGEAQDGSK